MTKVSSLDKDVTGIDVINIILSVLAFWGSGIQWKFLSRSSILIIEYIYKYRLPNDTFYKR